MKLVIVACALLAVALARPQQLQQQPTKPPVPILSQDAELSIDGSHHSSFQTGDGVSRSEQGVQKQLGPNDQGEAIQGQVSWTDNDGVSHSLTYTADENGYQPQGDLVPAIPAAIQRALEWNAAHPEEEDPKDSQRQ
ncbi:Endocuticle structural glycoprotein SgAbd-1 [Frankliniella fusca]|uniref:Endocuticle structural glycoprotein SgAbd-1 n=1 Tax=Frankliniella fusca TaxID=407009 RepID=A0AAE1HNI4_9NEOP|nr:Endocuticle structural glycoprotein SgAbd-1 [Frankliniella fusca]